jgi:hypothetical protein
MKYIFALPNTDLDKHKEGEKRKTGLRSTDNYPIQVASIILSSLLVGKPVLLMKHGLIPLNLNLESAFSNSGPDSLDSLSRELKSDSMVRSKDLLLVSNC